MTQIVCDLETIADPDAMALVEPPSAPSNYKDPEKIAAYVAEAKTKAISNMALKPAECRIVALGLGNQVTLCPDVVVEAAALDLFWHTWADLSTIVGFNFVGFDLPVLMVRSKLLRVPIPPFRYSKYGVDKVRDLMLELDPGNDGYHKLTWWCQRLNLNVPADPNTGGDIASLYAANDWAGIEQHCQIDLIKTQALCDYLTP
jgi:hypothetical protein